MVLSELSEKVSLESFSCNGNVSIVTGGSGGIGQGIALGLAKVGSKVVIADIDGERAEKVAIEISSLCNVEVWPLKVNVVSKQEVIEMTAKVINKFGEIDVLVNAAGITRRGNAEDMAEEDWDDVIAVNLKGTFLCCQAVGKEMIKKKSGKIINVASVVGQRGLFHPLDFAVSYCASKGGVIQLTRALAAEWARYNIHVNAIAPTYVITDMTKSLLENPVFSEYLKIKIPLQRPVNLDEVVKPVIFLASNASNMITGQILNIDGGWTAV